ncbi:thymidylate kinase [Zymomonas mobilis]|uniref:nucleoside triphosphate hydrolase n=1 Tax=Zymomonas mobilis TaxID=542 RepID=UPI00026D827A|nr:nucleoside triphosphate hydrolase [Zymomonas mobilis]AFN55939.1 putative nucleoside triphosphate hydrolase domain protein [Zymomonas mobilis subsp. mobilis ATCC 29191]ART94178.1 nucleoside triphosphate hydrolase [Zymomonas mobilis subsp. mobilis]TQK78630.1 thymidylate kinase [Zymomonas mobilis]TQL16165.1 thymidylate kinase [Zymomonas mobilis]TWD60935.1 thymidylate kinase [Zymomonas mobilis]
MPQPEPFRNRSAPLIALVGADGSGKTTVGQELLEWLQTMRPTAFCHLGKQTGNWGRAIARMPFVGKKLDKQVIARSSKARDEKGAGATVSIVIFALSMRRVFRFLRMRRLHRKGFMILTDRYPQAVVPGPMDGPGLVARNPKGMIARFLTGREQALYDWMASYKPDIVIRLNVDLETALKRKPDHRPASLERKVRDVPRLSFNGAPILDLDSREPLDQVIGKAKAAILDVIARYDQATAK